jgi:hypothetical protein
MSIKLILSKKLITKLDKINFTINLWSSSSINSAQELKDKIIQKLNGINYKLKIDEIEEGVTGERSSNYGYVFDDVKKRTIAYFFIIPPLTDSRSGFLAQHIYPSHATIMEKCINSNCYQPYNLPLYIINVNEFNLTDSKILNIRGAKTLMFNYADVFEREVLGGYKNLMEFDLALKTVNSQNENQYFEINNTSKTISFITPTLGSGTNDRYFYCAKVYPALYLACQESYEILTVDFELSPNIDNSTLRTFLQYANKLKKI